MRALVWLLLCANAHADVELAKRPREIDAWSVNAAYYGEFLLHPGVTVGVERSLKQWGRRRGLMSQGFFVEGDVGVWWHARNTAAVFLATDVGYRMIFPRGFRLELLVGLGYLHAFDDGPVYQVDGSGQISTVEAAGHPGLMMRALLGIGWDFTVGNHAPFSLFLRVGTFGQYPYNTAVLPHLEAQLGFSIPLGKVVRK